MNNGKSRSKMVYVANICIQKEKEDGTPVGVCIPFGVFNRLNSVFRKMEKDLGAKIEEDIYQECNLVISKGQIFFIEINPEDQSESYLIQIGYTNYNQ